MTFKGINLIAFPIAGLLQSFIQEAHAKKQRKHEIRMAEIKLITDSRMRDRYVEQLILDKFLAPVEKAQHKIQDAAKYTQHLAESIRYDYKKYNLTIEEAQEIYQELKFLAIQITNIDSLYDMRIVYEAITNFCERIFVTEKGREGSIERKLRKHILDKLNTCIAIEKNFQCRLYCMDIERQPIKTYPQQSLSYT